ncbi:MAG: hypothetical protein II179_01290 [Alphaproteobacteria bacterium]|nr:hypothetical protein [Alphaproteobacteria bacterium]
MKKKIIYISGADSFNPGEVRTAFEEVRSTLGLDADTVLFGVPVDDLIAVETAPVVADSVVAPTPDVTEEPVAKPKKTAKAKKEKPVEKTTEKPVVENPVAEKPATTPVVPILSVLGGGEESAPVAETTGQEVVAETVTVETDEMPEFDDIGDIDEMLQDDVPDAPHEKTLEELLETMTPLREDVQPDEEDAGETTEPAAADESLDDADATLASLATEFVDVQDKMPTFRKSPERGKISKLKSILPFKKKKSDDTGIMGDLFGWAGVAANDEDFSIPGFFTNVASKK